MSESISFTFEGREVRGRRGESLAAALIAAGVPGFRTTRTGAERGIFCGMGVCQDCLVEVDGQSNRRACMVKLDRTVTVRREGFARELTTRVRSEPPRTVEEIPEERPEILVVGAGPGGLSAAIAARSAGAQVVVLDERPLPGGQYFKQISVDAAAAPPDAQHEEGRRLIERARALGVEIRSGVEIWGAFPPATLAATQDGTVLSFAPKQLIVAAGAYERGVPFPGWTLPGVMTTGAAQTLWRSYRRLAGKRILIAGNGPLNFQVATELAAGGAEIAAVVELAEMPAVRSMLALAEMAIASPRLVREGMRYRRQLRAAGIPVVYGSAVTRVEAAGKGLTVHVSGPQALAASTHTFAVDTVCLGYGFHPSNEILRALGCAHDYDAARDQLITRVAADGKTTISTVFALGDCTGLGGARMALAQGTLTGCAVAAELGYAIPGDLAAERGLAQTSLARHHMFQAALWRLFAAPRLGLDLATPETVVCRCEEITAGQIEAALSEDCPSIGELKRTTRAGMGACQGRYCGPILSRLMAQRLGRAPAEDLRFAPRVPLKPVAVAAIARPAPK